MNQKLNLAVLFGGQSTEHDISVLSARNIITALDRNKYNIHAVYVTEQGQWYYLEDNLTNWSEQHPQAIVAQGLGRRLLLLPGQPHKPLIFAENLNQGLEVDCLFPIIHGTLGEDGAPQGLLEMLGVPYVGSQILSSTLCMNKHITKQLLRSAGIKTADWLVVTLENRHFLNFASASQQLGTKKLFIKPANLGSSVGMNIAADENQFQQILAEAFRYSETVIIEPRIVGREIECAVLGDLHPESTVPGEIVTHLDFYNYAAKYLEPEGEGATLITPAILDKLLVERFQQIAVQAYKILHCQGMARVDFFLVDHSKNPEIIVNEVNTIPGFTNMSMYPRLWQHNGIDYSTLLNNLIDLALSNYQRKQDLIRIYHPKSKKSTKTIVQN